MLRDRKFNRHCQPPSLGTGDIVQPNRPSNCWPLFPNEYGEGLVRACSSAPPGVLFHGVAHHAMQAFICSGNMSLLPD